MWDAVLDDFDSRRWNGSRNNGLSGHELRKSIKKHAQRHSDRGNIPVIGKRDDRI